MKIGRNYLCNCGSGKKYKKCHLKLRNNEDSKFSTPRNVGKKKSLEFNFIMDNSKRDIKLGGFFSKGEIERTAAYFNLDFNPENGFSFLILGSEADLSNFYTPGGKYVVNKNAKNEASMISREIAANSYS